VPNVTACHPRRRSSAGCRGSGRQPGHDGHGDDDEQHGQAPPEVECDLADAYRRHEPPEEAHGRIRDAVDDLHQHEPESARTPGAIERAHQIEHEPRPHHEEVDEQERVEDVPDDGQCAHKRLRVGEEGRVDVSSPDTTTWAGESRNTLLVTRSILP